MRSSLLDAIEKFIQEHPELGYKSVSDLAQEAVRLRLQALTSQYPTPSENEHRENNREQKTG